jgi:hypothetical protein
MWWPMVSAIFARVHVYEIRPRTGRTQTFVIFASAVYTELWRISRTGLFSSSFLTVFTKSFPQLMAFEK